jgi:hypothetical protein
MKKSDINRKVRGYTRDFSNTIYRQIDIDDYINEAIDRIREVIPELQGMTYLTADSQKPILLPEQYHNLIALYAASRCFLQDERQYEAVTFMNEFEQKLDELKKNILDEIIVITDVDGNEVTFNYKEDTVTNEYFKSFNSDIDTGVEGVGS